MMLFSTIDIMSVLWFGLAIISGYLLGSFSSGFVFMRSAGLGDIRTIGSGNTGATNVLRAGNWKLSVLTLLCDVFKGFVSVLIFSKITAALGLVAGFFAFFGHIFPVWLGFRGGKGVATYLGVLAGVSWCCAAIFCIVWFGIACFSRYSSLSAIVAAIIIPFVAFFLLSLVISAVLALMSVILIIKHAGNIKRLCNRTESKIKII